jgi:Flp pilus assembly protein CpaB
LNSRTRTGILIAIVGIVLIAAGMYAAVRLLNVGLRMGAPQPTPAPAENATTDAVVMAHDVVGGSVLTAADVKLLKVPIDLAPRDVVTNLDDAIGRIMKNDVFEGEMVLAHNLANPTGQAYDIAYVLDDRHVLMAIQIGDLLTGLKVVKRGDIVELYATYQAAVGPNPQGEQTVTFDSFQRLNITAMILGIAPNDNNTNPDQNSPAGPKRSQVSVQAYLLALDPQDALVLKYLKDTGANFDMVLRAPTSSGRFQLTPVTAQYIRELYGLGLLP